MKESEVRGSKRREGDERGGEAELAESGFAVERSRLRISGRPKGENPQTYDFFWYLAGSFLEKIYVPDFLHIETKNHPFWRREAPLSLKPFLATPRRLHNIGSFPFPASSNIMC